MPLILLASAIAFSCASPSHHDGDAIRCAGRSRSDRIYGIDAPEMPGACRRFRACVAGDPFAARDHLAGLTAGRSISCTQVDRDRYGRRVVRCSADGRDLSCAMIADGFAEARYGRLDCAQPAEPVHWAWRTGSIWLAVIAWLIIVNLATYAAFAIDKSRAIAGQARRVNRIPEATLLRLAAVGGSIGAIFAQQRLRHKTVKQPFASLLLTIAGTQFLIIVGLLILTYL